MDYYSDIKRNEIELLVVRWMDLVESKHLNVQIKKARITGAKFLTTKHMLTHIYGI